MNRFLFILACYISIHFVGSGQEAMIKSGDLDQLSLEELMNLKISTATKRETTINQISSNVIILTKQDIESSGFKNMTELLTYVTGYYHIEDYYWLGSANFGVRGYFKNGPFSNIAILVNGVSQLSDKYSDYPSVKITVPIESIERIEVVKGPLAITYGNGAFFGAINIITDPTLIKKNQSNISTIAIGTLQSYRANLKLGGKLDRISYNLVFSADHTNNSNQKYTNLTTDTALLHYVGLNENSTIENQLSQTNYYGNMRMSIRNFTFDLSFNQSIKGVFDGLPSINNGTKLTTDAINFTCSYTKEITKSFNINSTFGLFSHGHFLNYSEFRDYYYEIDMQKTNSYEFDFNTQWSISPSLNLLSGINRRTTLGVVQISDFDYYGLDYGDGKAGLAEGTTFSTNALYGQLNYTPLASITLNGGVRVEKLDSYDMYVARGVVSEDPADNRPVNDTNRKITESTYAPENNGLTIVPKLAILYNPTVNQTFKLIYSEAQKHPSISENYRQLPGNRPQLKKSKIKTIELNYSTLLLLKISISSSLFYNQLDNLITATNQYNSTTGEWSFYSYNTGKLNSRGVEIDLKYEINRPITIEIGGTYQKTNDLRDGYTNIRTAYSPALLAHAKASFKTKNKITIALLAKYVGEMETDWTTQSTPENGKRLSDKSNAFTTLDLNLRKEHLFTHNIYMNLKINNLLNSKYRYPTTKSNSWIDKGVPGESIQFFVTAGIKF